MKKFWRNLKLRLSLLRIWFVKNILLFLQTGLIVILICMFTGAIRPETPIIGPALNTIFGGLIEEIRNVIEARKIDNFMTFLTVSLSVLTTVGMFAIKAKSIAQTDIKSDKMKIAMLQAKLYFNSDGKLVKRVEKATQSDLDGDGDVGEATVSGNFFTGFISAIKEFIVISTAKFDDDPDNNEEEKKGILEKANLTAAAEGQKELMEQATEDGKALIRDELVGELANAAEIAKEDETLSEEDKKAKIAFFGAFSEWLHKVFSRKPKEKKEEQNEPKPKKKEKKQSTPPKKEELPSVDVIVDNVEKNIETVVETAEETIERKLQEAVREIPEPEVKDDRKPQIANSKMPVNDFLKNLRNTKR